VTKPLTSLLVHDLPAWRVTEAGHPVRITQERLEESVVVEATVELKVNGRTLLRFRCLPDRLDDLAVGFLASEGLIESPAQIRSLGVDPDCIRVEVDVALDSLMHFFETVTLVSGCGRGGSGDVGKNVVAIASQEQFSSETCLRLVRALQGSSAVFQATGGVHTAALGRGDGLLDVAEDIGRHNAVDKVIGRRLGRGGLGPGLGESFDPPTGGFVAANRPPRPGTTGPEFAAGIRQLTDGLMLLTTGRISGDIAAKAYRVGLPMVVSPSAPTTAAVELAERAGICLVGFARGRRLNVYSASWRLGLPTADGDPGREGKSE
jgi:FdhD protein